MARLRPTLAAMENAADAWRGVRPLPADALTLPLPEAPEAHELEAGARLDGAVPGLRLRRPADFVADLEKLGFALVRCPAAVAEPIRSALRFSPPVLAALHEEAAAGAGEEGLEGAIAAAGLAPVYKRQSCLKERLQLRRAEARGSRRASTEAARHRDEIGIDVTGNNLDDDAAAALLVEATAALEAVCMSCFQGWCGEAGVPAGEALAKFGDRGFATPDVGGRSKAKSVLNFYKYFNDEACEEEPCREHADPGLLTVLCRSTNPALQLRLPVARGRSGAYEDVWRNVEPAMDAAALNGQGRVGQDCVLLVIVGETLERLSGGRLAACQHRVAKVVGPRLNLAYEMRPRQNVWHPWPAAGSAPARGEATAADARGDAGAVGDGPPGGAAAL